MLVGATWLLKDCTASAQSLAPTVVCQSTNKPHVTRMLQRCHTSRILRHSSRLGCKCTDTSDLFLLRAQKHFLLKSDLLSFKLVALFELI